MLQEIYIVDGNNNLKNELNDVFKEEKEYRFRSVKTSNLEEALKNIPSLIIINEDTIEENAVRNL